MRLIDAHKLLDDIETNKDTVDIVDIVESIIMSPTVDAVPVIRCKDCRYFKKFANKDWCRKHTHDAEEVGFCSWAERKEE